MTEKVQQQETAIIIPFPVKTRAGRLQQASGRRMSERPAPATVEFGSGWYHEAAIQDAEQARRR
jgi:hypothetical protein